MTRGRSDSIAVSPAGDVTVSVPRQLLASVDIAAHHPASLQAPLQKATVIGELSVSLNGTELATTPLIVSEAVPSRGWYLSIEEGVARWKGLDDAPVSAAQAQ